MCLVHSRDAIKVCFVNKYKYWMWIFKKFSSFSICYSYYLITTSLSHWYKNIVKDIIPHYLISQTLNLKLSSPVSPRATHNQVQNNISKLTLLENKLLCANAKDKFKLKVYQYLKEWGFHIDMHNKYLLYSYHLPNTIPGNENTKRDKIPTLMDLAFWLTLRQCYGIFQVLYMH